MSYSRDRWQRIQVPELVAGSIIALQTIALGLSIPEPEPHGVTASVTDCPPGRFPRLLLIIGEPLPAGGMTVLASDIPVYDSRDWPPRQLPVSLDVDIEGDVVKLGVYRGVFDQGMTEDAKRDAENAYWFIPPLH
jgi:hypothetical protein